MKSDSATRILLMIWLLLACLPSAAIGVDDERDEPLTLEAASAAALVRAFNALPAVVWPDARAPESVADFVPAVREQLWRTATEGLRLPLHLRFLEARCQVEGTSVALIFEAFRPPYLFPSYAVAVRGSLPTSTDDSWAGAYGIRSVERDPEFIQLMGNDTVPCP